MQGEFFLSSPHYLSSASNLYFLVGVVPREGVVVERKTASGLAAAVLTLSIIAVIALYSAYVIRYIGMLNTIREWSQDATAVDDQALSMNNR